jgi:two-component system, sensor histidine kinase and response regulator
VSALNVLLAEDNAVNQLVATRIIEKLGHRVTVVANGRDAVAAVQNGKFDLVAMDVQMPEMDGLDATVAIRLWEKTQGTHIPIVAMTAHAMKGDRERCLAAGMDGYTSKPIRITDLEQVIRELMSTPGSVKKNVSQPRQAHGVIDHEALLAGVDGNRRLLCELVSVFLEDSPKQIAQIQEAIRRGDSKELARAAHTLKGSIGNFAAKRAFAAAQRLEATSRSGDLRTVDDEFAALEVELTVLDTELRKFLASGPEKRGRRKPAQV